MAKKKSKPRKKPKQVGTKPAAKKNARGKRKAAASKKKAVRSTNTRATTLIGVIRCLAFTEIFRHSRGRWLTIKDLQDAAEEHHRHVFDTRPSEDTVSRAVNVLREAGVPITETTAGEAHLEGSPKQLAWRHTPSEHLIEGLDGLSGIREKLNTLIELAVAAEAFAPHAGLAVYDGLADIRKALEQAAEPELKRKAESVAKRYRVTSKKAKTSSLPKVAEERRALLRTIDQCVRDGVRIEISHTQQFGQPHEKQYLLEPRALNQRNGSLYLFAHRVVRENQAHYANLRQFKVSRITSAKGLNEANSLAYRPEDGQLTGLMSVSPQDPINLEGILSATIHDFLPPANEQPLAGVEIVVDAILANWVLEEKIHPLQKTSRETSADGKPVLRVRIEKAYKSDIDKRLLGLGKLVKVQAPAELAAHLRSELQTAADQYGASDDAATEGGKPPRPS